MGFSRTLRRLRLAGGFSQEELAERAGLSARGVRALEAGHRTRPRPETVRMLADALGLDDQARTELIAAARPELARLASPVATEQVEPVAPAAPPFHRHLTPPPLPIPPTRLIGREREVAMIHASLCRDDRETSETVAGRLLTLTGPGGVGKTRLALAAGHELADCFEDLAWIELASLRDPASVPNRVAAALGVSVTGHSPMTALTEALRPRHLLLILDNCEHLLEPVAALVAALLAACPRLVVLATSRERLHLRGEREAAIAPLAVPSWETPGWGDGVDDQRGNPDAGLAGIAAVRLFAERAAEAAPGFTFSTENSVAVVELCRRLDGLPLAIELAAARVKVLPPAALLERIERRLHLLHSGPRDLPARQQTMRDAIAWSFDLLSAGEQTFFRRLAVFVGGFDLEGAAAVCGDDGGLCDAVASLVDKSLIRQGTSRGAEAGGPRFTMLETIREFGLEQLAASGEADAIQERHASWCLDLAERAWQTATHKTTNPTLLNRVRVERDNLRAALVWLEPRDATRFVQLAGSLWVLWGFGDHGLEGRAWLERALAHHDVPGAARTRTLQSAAIVAWSLGDVEWMAEVAEDLLDLARALGDDGGIASGLYSLGEAALFRGDFVRAGTLLTEANAVFREQQNASWIAFTVYRLGLIAYAQGDLDRAEGLLGESIALHHALDDQLGGALSRDVLGAIACDRGDLAGAAAHYQGSLPFWAELGRNEGLAYWMTGVAALAVAGGRPAQAARVFGVAEALLEGAGAPLRPPWQERRERALAGARIALGDSAFDAARKAGWSITSDSAVREAKGLLARFAGG